MDTTPYNGPDANELDASLKRALEQSAAGDVQSMGDFTQYADDDIDEDEQ